MTDTKPAKPVTYGGQAVIEGVMMRGPTGYAVAVRRPTGEITTRFRALPLLSARNRFFALPMVRGVAVLAESLGIGMEALMFSANEAGEEDEKITKAQGGLAVAIGVALAVGLFVLLPTVVAGPLTLVGASPAIINLSEGLLRLVILVAYIWVISRMPDIQRVFAYHGAEHKVINAYDAGGGFDPDTAAAFPTAHRRCGTSFLLFVVVVSVALFSFFGWPSIWVRLATRLALLPVVAGLAYEALRWGARSESPFVRWLVAPGLALQRMTTREPDRAQLEVAATALAALEPPSGRV